MKKVSIRVTSLLLAAVLSISSTAAAAGSTIRKDTEANYLKYITGFSDGTIHPDAPVTRAQAAKMLFYVVDAEGETQFSDVSESFWGYSAITRLAGAKILTGYPDGTFRPEQGMTRAAFATVLARVLGLAEKETASKTYSDLTGHWARGAILALADAGYISGYKDGTFRPDEILSRAEAVTLINHATEIHAKSEGSVSFSDLSPKHWAYGDLMAAASPYALESNVERASVKFGDIQYLEVNVQKIKTRVDALLKEFASEAASRQAEIYNEISKISVEMGTAYIMTVINSGRDVSNAQYQTDYENLPALNSYYNEMLNDRYEAVQKTKYPVELSKQLGFDIKTMEKPAASMPETLTALYQEEAKLVAQFNQYYYSNAISYEGKSYSLGQALYGNAALKKSAEDYALKNYKIPGQIFDQLVKVRTKIANFYGFDDYVEVGYIISGKQTYGPEQTKILRDEIKQKIAPLMQEIVKAEQNPNSAYVFPNSSLVYTEKVPFEEVGEAVKALSPQSRQVLEHLEKYDMMDIASRENKQTGAFSINIPEFRTPFLFMNYEENFDGLTTFSHEFGHCVQFFRLLGQKPNLRISSDLAEIASYGMEMVMTNSYSTLFGANADEAERELLFQDMNLLLSSAMMDEFQVEVYRNPNMTIEARNALYAKMRQEYFGALPANAHEAQKKGMIWVNPTHIFGAPFYAIDYALALSVALQIWEVTKQDFDAGFELYLGVTESDYTAYGIDAVCRVAGMKSPFAEDGISGAAALLKKQFLKSSALAKAS